MYVCVRLFGGNGSDSQDKGSVMSLAVGGRAGITAGNAGDIPSASHWLSGIAFGEVVSAGDVLYP